MQDWGFRLLFLSLFLYSIGYVTGIFSLVIELIRFSAMLCLSASLVLLFLDYLRTPDPQGH